MARWRAWMVALALALAVVPAAPAPVAAGSGVDDAIQVLAHNAALAQQLGTLAGLRNTSGLVGELADRMVAVNSGIAATLEAQADLPSQASPQALDSFAELARAEESAFVRALVAWVQDSYPDSIRALERLQRHPRFATLAGRALPSLRDQLAIAAQLAQAADDAAGASALAALVDLPAEMAALEELGELVEEQIEVRPAARDPAALAGLRRRMAEHRPALVRLRRALTRDDIFIDALRLHGAAVSDAVALEVLEQEGRVVIYTLPPGGPQQAEQGP